MQTFTGWEYMLIDLANNFGLDKKLFEERIQWAKDNLHQLEQVAPQADNYPLFMKAVLAIRKVLRGEPTGHIIGFDAVCSGIQIMSALTGCVNGARATGLIDPDVRADAYTQLTTMMRAVLGTLAHVERGHAKDALMTMFYGSKLKPIEIFGENTPELNAFYQCAHDMAPGAWEVLQDLLASWQPFALSHQWVLPDGFEAKIKVMKKIGSDDPRSRVEVDELNHATFTYEYFVNEGSKTGLSNVANVIHSIDAYIMRTMHRRCNYDPVMLEEAMEYLYTQEDHYLHGANVVPEWAIEKVANYIRHYERSGMADITILKYLDDTSVGALSKQHVKALIAIGQSMQKHNPFAIVTVHDEFKCCPNNMNHLRQHYINIFAELADSELLSDILSQIHGVQGKFPKLSNNLSDLIRNSNYALS